MKDFKQWIIEKIGDNRVQNSDWMKRFSALNAAERDDWHQRAITRLRDDAAALAPFMNAWDESLRNTAIELTAAALYEQSRKLAIDTERYMNRVETNLADRLSGKSSMRLSTADAQRYREIAQMRINRLSQQKNSK